MKLTDACLLILFGIILPSWDVSSDVLFSYKMIVPKKCNLTWEDYDLNHEIGMDHSNISSGKMWFSFLSCRVTKRYLFQLKQNTLKCFIAIKNTANIQEKMEVIHSLVWQIYVMPTYLGQFCFISVLQTDWYHKAWYHWSTVWNARNLPFQLKCFVKASLNDLMHLISMWHKNHDNYIVRCPRYEFMPLLRKLIPNFVDLE